MGQATNDVRRKMQKNYQLIQDLRTINKITEDIHPVVDNPYTLLTTVADELGWFAVVDLKDAFFCIPVHKNSQELFALDWENLDREEKSTYLDSFFLRFQGEPNNIWKAASKGIGRQEKTRDRRSYFSICG